MPGIYGYVKQDVQDNWLPDMKDALSYMDHFIHDSSWSDEKLEASRVHIGNIGPRDTPLSQDDVHLWVEGECYNLQECNTLFSLSSDSIESLLLEAYQKGRLDSVLNKLDGYFCAALYDTKAQKLLLISDRYGMRMLYWYCKDGLFAWGSEVKAILALDDVYNTLDQNSYDCFMDLGYMIGEHTWFEYIKLIRPATVLEYDLKSKKICQHHYWKWSEIKQSGMSFSEAVDELGKRFIESVRKRFNPDEIIGISLSGGLDSRAIFAAVNHLYPDYRGYAYTFGIPDCDDIKIAERVVARSMWMHEKFYFDDKNWFTQRIKKIWNTDGMLNMMHMHGGEFLNKISKNIDINLNGYAGDAILGGSFLAKTPLNKRIDENNSKAFYKGLYQLGDICSDFYDINHVEPNIYMSRVRRFTNMGTVNSLTDLSQRKPFFDNNVAELVFSLPDEYRVGNRLYSAMLLKYFPEFFKDIPWQKTGKTIDKSNSMSQRVIGRAKRDFERILGTKSTKDYTDYPNWIRSESVANELKSLLTREGSQYAKYTNEDFKEKYLIPHLSRKLVNNSEQILRAATMEIYLRKVKEQCTVTGSGNSG